MTAVELTWNGRRDPMQLCLDVDPGTSLEAVVLRGIMRELQEDGVRDWLVYHRMAGEQGGTGVFRWTWADHRKRTDYDRRIRTKNATDAELARAAANRLHRFQSAALRLQRDLPDGRIGWMVVGGGPLLVVTRGIDELRADGPLTTVAEVKINAELYSGAIRGSRDAHFALVPEAALTLPAMELRLLAMLAFSWRNARDDGGTSHLTARTLWGYADIRRGQPQRRHWPDAARTLERSLARLARDAGLDWTPPSTSGPEGVYTVRPPSWWQDRVLHGVRAELPADTSDVPRTGAELTAWRRRHGLSLRDVAVATGAGKTTVQRAEQERAREPLPPSWLPLLSRIGSRGGPKCPALVVTSDRSVPDR